MATKTFSEIITFTRASEATYYDAQGVLQTAAVNEPRLTHDPETGESLGLLIEEQRTNLYLQSQEFSTAEWSADSSGVTVTADDGPQLIQGKSADLVVFAGSSARLSQIYTNTDEKANSFAVRLVSGDPRVKVTTRTSVAIFDLSNGSVVSGNGFIKDLGSGFYLCTLVSTDSGSRANLRTETVAGSYHVAYAHLEPGSFPTSYIKTEGAQVTRSADNASVDTLTPWFNASEGTIYIEFSIDNVLPDSFNVLSIKDTGSSANISFHNDSGNWRLRTTEANLNLTLGYFVSGINKVAFSYFSSGIPISVNGNPVETNPSSVPSPLNKLYIGDGDSYAGGAVMSGIIPEIKFIPRVLTATELEALTAP